MLRYNIFMAVITAAYGIQLFISLKNTAKLEKGVMTNTAMLLITVSVITLIYGYYLGLSGQMYFSYPY